MELETDITDGAIVIRHEGVDIVRYRSGADASKAYVDRLALPHGAGPIAGRNLVVDAPHDHPWHHGLFFCQKLIDGVNCWEAEVFERDGRLHGRQSTGELSTSDTADGVRIDHDSWWRTTADEPLIRDRRRIEVVEPTDGSFFIHWNQSLIAEAGRRYLTSESLHGRYGGLCLRGSRELSGADIRLPEQTDPAPNDATPASWCDLSGQIDGSHDVSRPYTAGITMMHHPENGIDRSHWFTRNDPFPLVTANPIWDDVVRLGDGERIDWQWGIWIHEGVPDPDHIAEAYDRYCDYEPE